jgi:hypothetical protein
MFFNKVLLLSVLVFTLPSISYAKNASELALDYSRTEITLKFGGWSKHSSHVDKIAEKYNFKKIKYNESHRGFGLEGSIPFRDTNHYIFIGAWYMKDSYNKDSFHLGIGYKYRINTNLPLLDSIDLNIAAIYMNRGTPVEANIIKGYYDENYNIKYRLVKTKEIIRKGLILPVPYVTFNITPRINIDIALLAYPGETTIPSDKDSHYDIEKYIESLVFIKAGFTF